MDIKTPEIKTSFEAWTRVALVDHNEEFQTLDNLSDLIVDYVIDHHKIDFKTSTPLNMRVEPICSTWSILYKMYKEAWFEISKEIATMMLSCIISDSLLYRSATTTKEDVILWEELLPLTGIEDIKSYAMAMFEAKSDLWDIWVEDLIRYDYKEFNLNWNKVWIWTLETTNPWYGLSRKNEILSWLEMMKKRDNLDFMMLSIVDIIWEKNTTIVLDWKDSEIVEKVFNTKVIDNLADLKNRLSRKKQVIPQLTDFFDWK
jgi:manganese-dependent inorganic pyrophosphatase